MIFFDWFLLFLGIWALLLVLILTILYFGGVLIRRYDQRKVDQFQEDSQ